MALWLGAAAATVSVVWAVERTVSRSLRTSIGDCKGFHTSSHDTCATRC